MKQIPLADATKSLHKYVADLNAATDSLVFVDGEEPIAALVSLDGIDLDALVKFLQKQNRLANECARLDMAAEQALAEEGIEADLELWPEA